MDINNLKDNLNKSLADVSTKGIPSANFEPVWINNITRLNAQNFNARMYPTIASYITGYGNAVFEGSNEQLSNLLSILPGYKVADTSTSEIHNLDSDLSSTNEANGAYQAVFGIGNRTDEEVEGQFIVGRYNRISNDFVFAIGNGNSETERSNALEISVDGELRTSGVSVINGITTPYVKITTAITDTSDDTYAATKKYVFDKVKEESERAQEVENNKQDKFAKYIADPSAREGILTSITKQLDIISRDGSYGVSIAADVVGLHGNDPLGASLYIHSTTARFGSPSSTGIPVLGIATPVNTSVSGITTEDIPYQAVNKEYVDTNILDIVKFYAPVDSYSFAKFNTPSVGLTLQGGMGVKVTYDSEIAGIQLALSGPPLLKFTDATYICGIPTPIEASPEGNGLPSSLLGTQAVNKEYVDTNFQVKLISGTNIKTIKDDKTTAQTLLGSGSLSFKTINNQSLLGSGNIDISGGGGTITVDAELSETSTNPVQNKIITGALNNKQDEITNKTNLRLNRVILGNAAIILSADYNPTTGGTGYMLKVGGDQTSDKVRITNVDDGVAADNAVNKKQLDAKQDKFATITNVDSTQTVTIADTLTITTNPNLLADQIISTKALFLQGSPTSGVRLGKTVLEGSSDFDATAGYLRVRDNPLADDFAVNKKYVDDSVNTKLSATTDKYSISWDNTNEAIKITFKE